MTINVDIRENNRVIYFQIIDPWTLEDLFAGFAKSQAMRTELYQKEPSHQIHTFLDVRGIKDPPPLGTLRARQSPGITHPSRGEWIVLGANPVTKSMIEMMLKLAHFDKANFMDSETEAWAYIRKLIADGGNLPDNLPAEEPKEKTATPLEGGSDLRTDVQVPQKVD